MTLLPLLESKRRVINVDESWLGALSYQYRLWAPAGRAATTSVQQL